MISKIRIKKPELKVYKDFEGNFIIERIAHNKEGQKVLITNKENELVDEVVRLAEKYNFPEKTKKKLHKEVLRVISNK
jgi:hypothetical protein